MENNLRSTNINDLDFETVSTGNKILRSSFTWMTVAMLLTSAAAMLFAFVPGLTSILLVETELGFKPSILAYVVMFAPIIFVMVMSFALNKLSYGALLGLFISYALINGISFSFIFLIYNIGSIVKVFLSTTALFGVMAIAGYSTKTDLSKLGTLLRIGVIGIVIAMLINFFMHSARVDYFISVLGVIIFTGLTAYDVQKIKNVGLMADSSAMSSKLGIMGALTLYLDFINLFLFLLRLFGGKRD
ncbi:MAG TPA: Bax inhibitor-1/YccA family protein [Bacteroidia bacterium]|nr:Bax inhibitor-1/YccA family protein [Bacteroidia bacterium]